MAAQLVRFLYYIKSILAVATHTQSFIHHPSIHPFMQFSLNYGPL
jgi:hypothetical protein